MSAISKEYAGALFALCKEAGNVDEAFENLKQLSKVFGENNDYFDLLSSPAVEKEERISMLNIAIGDSVTEYVFSFVAVLVSNGHIKEFFECEKDFSYLYEQEKNCTTAFVRTAAELSENDKKRLAEKLSSLTGKNVSLEVCIDHSLIGGLIVEIDGKVYDGSLKQKIKTAKEVMGK